MADGLLAAIRATSSKTPNPPTYGTGHKECGKVSVLRLYQTDQFLLKQVRAVGVMFYDPVDGAPAGTDALGVPH